MLITDNQLIGKQSYSNGSTVIMEKRTEPTKASAESMKRRFGVFILCFPLSLLCIACGNTDFKEESNVANTTVKEYEVSSSEMNKGLNENYSLQQDADIELGTEKTEKETDLYVGEYNSYDINEPNLQIRKNDDGTYLIQIGIYRLTQLDNCIGVEVDDRIEFSTTEWGETNVITGTITVEDDVATVKLLAEWSDTWFKDTDEYKYYKTSNIPNIYEYGEYEGADNMCGEMNLSEELVDANNPEAGMKYILNGKEVSYDFYNSFRSKITAAEMYTD